MCLCPHRNTPYNHSSIGYKILSRNSLGKLTSYYQHTEWRNNELIASNSHGEEVTKKHRQKRYGRQYYGIHIFPSKKDALLTFAETVKNNDEAVVLVKVKVKGFIVAGKHLFSSAAADGKRSECWTHAKAVEIVQEKGKVKPWYSSSHIGCRSFW